MKQERFLVRLSDMELAATLTALERAIIVCEENPILGSNALPHLWSVIRKLVPDYTEEDLEEARLDLSAPPDTRLKN